MVSLQYKIENFIKMFQVTTEKNYEKPSKLKFKKQPFFEIY